MSTARIILKINKELIPPGFPENGIEFIEERLKNPEKKIDGILNHLLEVFNLPSLTASKRQFILNEASQIQKHSIKDENNAYIKKIDEFAATTSNKKLRHLRKDIGKIRQEYCKKFDEEMAPYLPMIEDLQMQAEVNRIIDGLEQQSELKLLKEIFATKANHLKKPILDFIREEIIALTELPMATSADYKYLLNHLIKLKLDSKSIEKTMETLCKVRSYNQALVTVVLTAAQKRLNSHEFELEEPLGTEEKSQMEDTLQFKPKM